MISKDSFFLEGRLLAKEEFLTRLASIPKIEGKTNVGLNAIKGCDPNEFITIRDELFGRGYLVCSSAHPIDLNEVYKQLATSNKVIIQANEPNKPTDRDGQAE